MGYICVLLLFFSSLCVYQFCFGGPLNRNRKTVEKKPTTVLMRITIKYYEVYAINFNGTQKQIETLENDY